MQTKQNKDGEILNQLKKSFKFILIGFLISLSIILICKGLTFIGLSEFIASTIAIISILIIPFSYGIYVGLEIEKMIKDCIKIKNANKTK